MTTSLDQLANYDGIRVTILGLGRFGGGIAAARFLASRGAIVTVTDMRTEAELAESLTALADVEIHRFALGGHPADVFETCDLLVVNPAVKPGSPHVEQSRSAGAVVTSEIELFLHHCPARVVGVTGSNGKSTTAALTHHFLQHHFLHHDAADEARAGATAPPRSFLGGNIGHSLLPIVDQLTTNDVVVLELSSFQLHSLKDAHFAPSVAIVTNFAANHLDWHGTVDEYHAAKQVLLSRQSSVDVAVMPDDCPVNRLAFADEDQPTWRVRGRCLRFGISDGGEDGVFLEGNLLIARVAGREDAVRVSLPRQLPGEHSAKNIAAAACAAFVLGVTPMTIVDSLASFQPLPHRLELVSQGNGRKFYNDSVATTPESAIAALRTFREPVVIIAGGSDKGSNLTSFANEIGRNAVAAVLIGDTALTLKAGLHSKLSSDPGFSVVVADDFESAFRHAVALSPEGSIVLLSPGCASYGWFRDFRDRGDQFTKLAQAWVRCESETQ